MASWYMKYIVADIDLIVIYLISDTKSFHTYLFAHRCGACFPFSGRPCMLSCQAAPRWHFTAVRGEYIFARFVLILVAFFA